MGKLVTRYSISCIICNEPVILSENEVQLMRSGHHVCSKICDKCKHAIIRMREHTDVSKDRSGIYIITEHDFDIMESHNPWRSKIIGYTDTENSADMWIQSRKEKMNTYMGWDGNVYPYYTKEKIRRLMNTSSGEKR